MGLDYITTDDIPLVGPDPYDPEDKEEAGEAAEEKLEADVNDGNNFDQTTSLHKEAIIAWATYRLATGAVSPTDAKSGDFYSGSGDDQAEFAAEMKNIYESNRSSILSSEQDESDDSSEFVV